MNDDKMIIIKGLETRGDLHGNLRTDFEQFVGRCKKWSMYFFTGAVKDLLARFAKPVKMVGGKSGLAQTHKLMGLANSLSMTTHFNTEECKLLLLFHQRIVECNGNLDRLRFRDILHVTFEITDDVMLDLTFKAFDRDNDGIVDELEWVRGLSSLIRGTVEELVEYVYFVYDMNGDRSLAREELYHCLKGCMHSGYGVDADEVEECERDIVEIAMKKLDVDKDGQITFTDFQNAVEGDPLLIQACGPCIPSPKSMAAFLALITEKYRSYTGCWGSSWCPKKVDKRTSKHLRKFSTPNEKHSVAHIH